MARLTLRRVRDNIDTRILGQTGLRNDQQIKRRILQRELDATGNLAIATVLNEQNKLVARQCYCKLNILLLVDSTHQQRMPNAILYWCRTNLE